MAQYRDARDGDDIFAFLLGLVLGVAGGSLLGILFAPKSGDALRKDLHAYATTLPNRVSEDWEDSRHKAEGFFSKTRIQLEDKVGKVNHAIRAGKLAEAKRREEKASGYDAN